MLLKQGECMFDDLANATVRIKCGSNSGSGFHFIQEETILTNHHVIEAHLINNEHITAYTENNTSTSLELLAYSPKDEYDFAILRAVDRLGASRNILQPKEMEPIKRGTEVAFSGFPHGISDLLVHRAFVSGPFKNVGFHIDGSVNGGNSGGPVVDISDGKVIGIITQRRIVGISGMEEISRESLQLYQYLQRSAGNGSVSIMGVNFSELSQMIAKTFLFTNEIIKANANSGIGIGFLIKFALEKYRELDIRRSTA